ncbi:MAG: SAM-dependent methyltransferase, partial [Pedobacter sp.]
MSQESALINFRNALSGSLAEGSFVKLSLGNYQGATPDLRQLHVRKVQIKGAAMLSFTYRYKTKDLVKNESIEAGAALISTFLDADFKIATLFITGQEIQFEILKSGKAVFREKQVKTISVATDEHDQSKKRIIGSKGRSYLHALGITDPEGNVFKHAQDKYRQINHYIEILAPLIKPLTGKIQHVADMGSGKGYLTFALYDFLTNELKMDVAVTGVEFRTDLVRLCNKIAIDSGFNKLNFIEGTIESYQPEQIDLLIALHACDTATDDAIFKGIVAEAELIVVAPCCHKQIRREMEKNKINNEVSFLTRHGIFMERQAEMATDGLRALLMEYAGYKTKVFEFIS